MKKTSVRLPDPLQEKLENDAEEKQLPKSELIRDELKKKYYD